MASIRSRNGKWQARITRKGQLPVAKSFQSKQDAERRVEECKQEYYKTNGNKILAELQQNIEMQEDELEEMKLEHISNNIIEQITTLYGDDIRTFLRNTRGDGREDSDKIVFAINVIIDTIILKLIETIESPES